MSGITEKECQELREVIRRYVHLRKDDKKSARQS